MGASKRRDFAHDAEPAPSSPCHVLREYVGLISYNSGQCDKIGGLFSDGAVIYGPRWQDLPRRRRDSRLLQKDVESSSASFLYLPQRQPGLMITARAAL